MNAPMPNGYGGGNATPALLFAYMPSAVWRQGSALQQRDGNVFLRYDQGNMRATAVEPDMGGGYGP